MPIKHIKHHSKRNPVLVSLAALSAAALLVLMFTNGATIIAQARSLFIELESGSRQNVALKSASSASGGKYVQFTNATDTTPPPPPDPDPDPEPDPAPTSWQQAWDSRSQTQLDSWYEANTGFDSAGYSMSELWDVGGSVDIDTTWLNANNGKGHVSQSGGRWIVEGIKATRIRIETNNVTLRSAFVEMGTNGYGIQHNPSFGSSITGTRVENCTVKDRDGQGSEGVGILLHSTNNTNGNSIIRNCELYNVRTGFHWYSGDVAEYNYVHDIYRFSGSHNTAGSVRGSNVTLLRNNFADGTSSAVSVYPDNPIHNTLIQQNLFNGRTASYCVFWGAGKPGSEASTNNRVIGNLFGRKFQPECGTYGAIGNNSGFSELSNNYFLDGAVAD